MKFRRCLLSCTLLYAVTVLSALPVLAQSAAKITAKQIVSTRKDTHKPVKKVVIRYPVVSGLASRSAQQRARAALSLSSLFRATIGSTWQEMREDDWIDEADYEVAYNQHGLLDIAYSIAGSAAYPDGNTHHFVLDLKTGRLLGARDLFTGVGMHEVANLVEGLMQADIRKAIATAKKEGDNISDQLKSKHFEVKDLNHFTVNARGITFLYDFGFPHVIQALEPEGSYFIPYPKLKLYLRPNSPLQMLVRP